MKIGILGTKGIPNNYGGFEQFAEYLSTGLAARGHDVTVYNPHFHPYKRQEYEGVRIKRIYSPERFLGGSANFIYDYLCLRDALATGFDLVYEAGYHSVAPAYWLLNVRRMSRPVIITNMDGLEWKRSKWNSWTRKLIRKLEKVAVFHSHFLISDNSGIQAYYQDSFQVASHFLPYGADEVTNFNDALIRDYKLIPNQYFLVIARLEPENNIEMILDGYLGSSPQIPICIVGNNQGKFGKLLQRKYNDPNIRFLGSIFTKSILDSLRHYSFAYLHGHSVGGTNPSLLEAMACKCFIIAHENIFNRSVLRNNALYFNNHESLAALLANHALRQMNFVEFSKENTALITDTYRWHKIVDQHEQLFKNILETKATQTDVS